MIQKELPENIKEKYHNPCILTGALVIIEEYPAAIRCDAFLVGETVIFTGFGSLQHLSHLEQEHSAQFFDEADAFISMNNTLLKENHRFVAVPWSKIHWTSKGEESVRFNLSVDGVEV